MELGVELGGSPELEDRLAHAQAGVMDLTRKLGSQLQDATPPQLVFSSIRMRARQWGTGDLWTLPAGGWIAGHDGGVHLPDDTEAQLQRQVQQLLDGK